MKLYNLGQKGGLLAVALQAAACGPLTAQHYGDCDVRRVIELDLPANGIDLLDVTARAGSLEIIGEAGAREVTATATLCASSDDRMEGLDATLQRSGSRAVFEAVFPENDRGWNNGYAKINVELRVPQGLDAIVEDGSGHAVIEGTGSLEVEDGSGHLEIRDILGSVEIDDGSGHVEIFDVAGSVRLDDGSGGITISGVEGDVRLIDGSGPVDIERVSQDVEVTDKGSGPIVVNDVDGDLRVSGTRRERIRYDNIGGTLDLPAPRRRGRGNDG